MTTYIMLANWTDQGARKIRESPRRLDAAKKALEDMGVGSRPLPTGRLGRMWSLGTLQAKIAAAYLAWWLRSGFLDEEAKQRGLDETHVSAAIAVLGRMSYLRGAVMKLGQVIAHWPHVAPLAFSSVLAS